MMDSGIITYQYNAEKSALLERERGINFDAVIKPIEAGNILNVYDNPNQVKYPRQQIYALDIAGYVYLVPFVRQENNVFLKTIFPSRTATKQRTTQKGIIPTIFETRKNWTPAFAGDSA